MSVFIRVDQLKKYCQRRAERDLFYQSWNPPLKTRKSFFKKNKGIALDLVIIERSKRKLEINVVEVDLDVDTNGDGSITDADDADEESKGVVLLINADDNNANGTLDKDEPGTVAGENDLVPLNLKLNPNSLSSGELKLEDLAGSTKIKVWENATKGTAVTLPKTWTIGTDTVPATLYIEGIEISGTERDVELKLSYSYNGTEIYRDSIKATVISVEFETFEKSVSGPDKPHEINLETRWNEVDHYDPIKKSMSSIWSSPPLDLIPFLKDHESISQEILDSLVWKDNGQIFASGIFEYNLIEPGELTFHEHEITVELDGEILDRLLIVVIPNSTYDSFQNWYNTEKQDLSWLSELPKVYEYINIISGTAEEPEPVDCDPENWYPVQTASTYFHPDAFFEMRSISTNGGHGHQAAYSQSGQLILSGVSAGTADKRAPSSLLFGSTDVIDPFPHVNEDVIPFMWALHLDGNPVEQDTTTLTRPIFHSGAFVDKYLEVRPPHTSNTLLPGECQ